MSSDLRERPTAAAIEAAEKWYSPRPVPMPMKMRLAAAFDNFAAAIRAEAKAEGWNDAVLVAYDGVDTAFGEMERQGNEFIYAHDIKGCLDDAFAEAKKRLASVKPHKTK